MGNWLRGRTDALTYSLIFPPSVLFSALPSMASVLDTMKKRFMEANDAYYQTAQNVAETTDGSGLAEYSGPGAQAFLQAVDADINTTKPLVDSFAHVATASDALGNAIQQSSSMHDQSLTRMNQDPNVLPADFKKWREALIDRLFENADPGYMSDTLSEILKHGWWGFLTDPWNTTFFQVQRIATQDANTFSESLAKNGYSRKDQQKAIDNYMTALDNMSRDICTILQDWAGDLQSAYQTFQTSLKDASDTLSARDLYDLIYYGSMDGSYKDGSQSTISPITITPYTTKDGKKGLLITLGGTDLSHLTNDDSILGALETGSGLPDSYQELIQGALAKYLAEHPEFAHDPNGVELTIAGYSLGGMEAQILTKYLADGALPWAKNLHVANVITYGSPIVEKSPVPGVNYTMYDAIDDPIPLLSDKINPEIDKFRAILMKLDSNPIVALQKLKDQGGDAYKLYLKLIREDQLPWPQKLQLLDPSNIDPHHQYHIIPLTDVGNTSLGTGDPGAGVGIVPGPNGFPLPIPQLHTGHQFNFNNHLQYYQSTQLNNSPLDGTNIDPASLGPTEYFPIKA